MPNNGEQPYWPAPHCAVPVQASIAVPGSKSQTNRYLALAALAECPTTIERPLRARDTALMAQALGTLGAQVQDLPGGGWLVHPLPEFGGTGSNHSSGPRSSTNAQRDTGFDRGPSCELDSTQSAPRSPSATIDCGLAGTVMRFVPPIATLAAGTWHFDGDAHARARPMGIIVQALHTLGATFSSGTTHAADNPALPRGLPFSLRSTGSLRGGSVVVDASTSSQFISALLLAGCRFEQGVQITHVGQQPPPSQPYVDMSVDVLRRAGIGVHQPDPHTWIVEAGAPRLGRVQVEPDLSNAAPFLAAAMVTGGTVHLPDWPQHTTQPGAQLPGLLEQMGATISQDFGGLHVTGPAEPQALHGLDADLREVGELAPVLAAICAVAASPSTLRGIAHLRGHETDRLAAITAQWARVGVQVQQLPDGLHIRPPGRENLRPAQLLTYDDHRMATAAAVLALVIPGVQVHNIATVAKTMPDFVQRWEQMLASPSAQPHLRPTPTPSTTSAEVARHASNNAGTHQ